MSKEFKEHLQVLRSKYKRIDDKFLDLFEKRYVVFIENGVDLKTDCKLFGIGKPDKGWDHQEKMVKIDVNRAIVKYDFDVARQIRPTIVSGVEYHEDF
jgi:hypothetical protein